MSIIIKNLSYVHPDREVLFQNISFTILKGQKASLIGDNGSGKSTLLRILANEIRAYGGELICDEPIYNVPQHFGQYDNQSIGEAIRVDKKLNALYLILGGEANENNLMDLADDWNIEERIKQAFLYWEISHLSPSKMMKNISGGEKTKVFLSGIMIHQPSVILMDEPSNHLDSKSRGKLYEYIMQSNCTTLVVSHDRALLNLLPYTYELTKNGINGCDGNYEFYKEQKDEKIRALKENLNEKEKALRKARRTAQEAMERKQKAEARSEKYSAKKGIPRIILNNLGSKAENSTAKLKDTHNEKIESISKTLNRLREDLPHEKELKLNFHDALLHLGKVLVIAEKINFGYAGNSLLWDTPLSFQLRSGDRVAISGTNGSGKTTLLKLIFGLLTPTEGSLNRSGFSYVYVDQDYTLINGELTVLEQISRFNIRNLPEHELKTLLNRFLFPYGTWNKLCEMLSGGEKMRLIFCCLMISNNTPDLFVLDEPTNNLDIQSLETISSMLKNYKGTVLVISHDAYFLNEIGIDFTITLK